MWHLHVAWTNLISDTAGNRPDVSNTVISFTDGPTWDMGGVEVRTHPFTLWTVANHGNTTITEFRQML